MGKFWDANAADWTKLARAGCDVFRDHVNTPAFMSMLGEVKGLKGLDIGCGEGHNTRLIASRSAAMTAVDISEVFINQARQKEQEQPLGIEYKIASAVELPFSDAEFDFAVATMSFMDIPETERVISEAYRILKPGGFLQFSICHPCFVRPDMDWITDDNGKRVAMKVKDYYSDVNGDIEEWIFSDIPGELQENVGNFRIPAFTRILSKWLNLLIETGFVLEKFAEPKAEDEAVKKYPSLSITQIVAWFLIIRCRRIKA